MHLNRLIRDRRGSAAVEFALILPVVMLLYYGMVEATQAVLANRRAGVVTVAVGDLVAQSPQLSRAQIDDIFNISTTVMKPFPTSELGIRLVSIQNNASGVPKEQWRQEHGAATLDAVDFSDIKDRTAGAAFIRAETKYTYHSPLNRIFKNAFVFKHQMDFKPRGGVAVVRLD